MCDNVAILRGGRLAATGKLDDLLNDAGETQTFEINVKGVSAESLQDDLKRIAGAEIFAKANGANIHVLAETDIDKILEITREKGGRLVSVQPVKQSLEELFVKETN